MPSFLSLHCVSSSASRVVAINGSRSRRASVGRGLSVRSAVWGRSARASPPSLRIRPDVVAPLCQPRATTADHTRTGCRSHPLPLPRATQQIRVDAGEGVGGREPNFVASSAPLARQQRPPDEPPARAQRRGVRRAALTMGLQSRPGCGRALSSKLAEVDDRNEAKSRRRCDAVRSEDSDAIG